MKVFKFHCGESYWAFAAQTKELAESEFTDQICEPYTSFEEIPETEWDNETISIWEDNNFENESFKISIREAICGIEPQLIFTNDSSDF